MQRSAGMIGFGEAGRAFAGDPRWSAPLCMFDVLTMIDHARPGMLEAAAAHGARAAESLADLVAACDLVLSVVTADQALHVASDAAATDIEGKLFFDLNSVAPDTKRAAAQEVERAGGRYVDVAVMSPVLPKRLDTPLLLSGPHAPEGEERLRALGFTNTRVVGEEIGRASSIKIIRSVMIKGLEALTAECLLAAARADVTDEVLASLGEDWEARADYNLDRMIVHGERRAAEMGEVAATLRALGATNTMASAAADWQRAIGRLGLTSRRGLAAKLETLSAAMRKADPT